MSSPDSNSDIPTAAGDDRWRMTGGSRAPFAPPSTTSRAAPWTTARRPQCVVPPHGHTSFNTPWYVQLRPRDRHPIRELRTCAARWFQASRRGRRLRRATAVRCPASTRAALLPSPRPAGRRRRVRWLFAWPRKRRVDEHAFDHPRGAAGGRYHDLHHPPGSLCRENFPHRFTLAAGLDVQQHDIFRKIRWFSGVGRPHTRGTARRSRSDAAPAHEPRCARGR